MNESLSFEPLLGRVAERLDSIGTTTDQLLLTRWRVLALCQYVLGSPRGDAKRLSIEALEAFARDGVIASAAEALTLAGAAIAQDAPAGGGSVRPTIAPAKRDEVISRLREYEVGGAEAIRRAIKALPALRDRLQQSPAGALIAGIRHRLELVAALLLDADGQSEGERCKAAAAILYFEELQDAIPDTLGRIGLLDDDFALRVVLEELGKHTEDERLHWSERIASLWDDLPFLQGVHLRNDGEPVATTWLDRINSHVSYSHALGGEAKPLILVQPSVACSPLHSIVSLIGLLVLDGLTSSNDRVRSLHEGQVYEIDGRFYCQYGGVSDQPLIRGRLALVFRDGVIYRTAAIADRMVAVQERSLSPAKAFASEVHWDAAEPIQRFFNWEEAIGAAAVSARLVLVTTQQRAADLFQGIESNGVDLLDDGLVRFLGLAPSPDALRSGFVLVVPNLTVARELVEQGVDVHAILVDGYQRLHRGRHDLPFLLRKNSPPPIIVWSSTGYYPTEPPPWLPEHRRLEVPLQDLSYILELDGELDDHVAPSHASLWEAVTGPNLTKVLVTPSAEERELVDAIKNFLEAVRRSASLPDYWKYHLLSSATMLASLITATPSCWSDIGEVAASWKANFNEQWATLRSRFADALESVAESHRRILEVLDAVTAERNTKADALLSFLASETGEEWKLVCDRPEQVKLAARLAHRTGASGFEPVMLRDLGVCRACIVVGWRNLSFGRRIWSHTPRRLVALVGEEESQSWDRVAREVREISGESLLEAIGHRSPDRGRPHKPREGEPILHNRPHEDGPGVSGDEQLVPCVFIWLVDEPEAKVLARDARVLMEIGDQARERRAHRIQPEDRVILGPGSARWSPADEFTEAVVEAVEASHPELVRNVKEWRRALERLREARQWPIETLRSKLEEVGVTRELQTLAGWLRLDRAAPIGPQHIQKELDSIWELVAGDYTKSSAAEVAEACSRLRSLRSSAGRALLKTWKGRAVNLGVSEAWLDELVDRLRQEVQVHEVDAVTYGQGPETMLGWWVTPDLAAAFELSEPPSVCEDVDEVLSEDD